MHGQLLTNFTGQPKRMCLSYWLSPVHNFSRTYGLAKNVYAQYQSIADQQRATVMIISLSTLIWDVVWGREGLWLKIIQHHLGCTCICPGEISGGATSFQNHILARVTIYSSTRDPSGCTCEKLIMKMEKHKMVWQHTRGVAKRKCL